MLRLLHRGPVVREGVEPHVHHVRRVLGNRDAPLERGARDAQVVEAGFDEADDLVHARLRSHEVGVALVELEEPVLELRETEEVAGLLDELDGLLVRGADVARLELFLGVVGLAADAVPALIVAEEQVAVVTHHAPQALHLGLVPGLGGADEVVKGARQTRPGLLEGSGSALRILGAAHPLFLSHALDLQTVLVGAGQKPRVVAAHAVVARDRVGRDRGVGGAQMRHVVDVVDGRGCVEGRHRA